LARQAGGFTCTTAFRLRSTSATGDRHTSRTPLRRRLTRAATPVVRISAQSAADAAVGDGSAPRGHAPHCTIPHATCPHSRTPLHAATAHGTHRDMPRPLRRSAKARGTPPVRARRCAVPRQRPRRSSPRSCMPHTAPLDACTHHMHRPLRRKRRERPPPNRPPRLRSKLAKRGRRAALRAQRRSGSAPRRRQVTAPDPECRSAVA